MTGREWQATLRRWAGCVLHARRPAPGSGVGSRRRTLRRVLILLPAPLALFLLFLAADALAPFPVGRLSKPSSTLVLDREGRPLRAFLSVDQKWRFPLEDEALSPEVVETLIAAEDRWFRHHPGVNPLAVARAAWSNLRAGRIVSGASTIPMQVARMSDPGPRTLGSKLVEAFRALQLRWHLDDERILEAWLNLAPCGGNVEGIGAAAWFYFGKEPRSLSLGEAALLVALPRSPTLLDPARDHAAAVRARDAVLDRLEAGGVFPPERIALARREPVPRGRRPAPMEAPHFARELRDLEPGVHRIHSTLDRAMQRTAESVLRGHVPRLRAAGIGNVAAVVLDVETRAVRALVGSAGFGETAFQGQVNGAVARRSPGSTLKPFLYAMAMDDGLILPESWLLDVPIDFSGYVAENYDGEYEGKVTAAEALRRSLNAPAIWLLSRVGLEPFHGLLRAGGLETLDRPAAHYGLPLVLGGGEVRLLDLTNLYATLAAGGIHRPVVMMEGESSGRRLFSREATGIVQGILTQVERPDLPESWALAREAPAVAWKTGTSFGHRDAWAVGTARGLAIGVWLGNFDGAPVRGISGSAQAGPVLMDLVRALGRGSGAVELAGRRARRTHRIELCALSHERPGPLCTHRVTGTFIEGRSRIPECTWHRRVFRDDATGALLDGRCLAGRRHSPAVIERYPPELAAWWVQQGRQVAGLARPERTGPASGCEASTPGGPPRIISPDPATPYRIRHDAPRAFQRIPLLARQDGTATTAGGRHFWYQDGRLIASGPWESPQHAPLEPGTHKLVVVDEAGRSDSLTYVVEN